MMNIKKRELYLSEVMERDVVEYSSNNLILSPVGSGKTHFMFNKLASNYDGPILVLVSTTFLKESLMKEDGVVDTKMVNKQAKLTNKDRYVMTYAEFGNKVVWDTQDDFLSKFSAIFSDEIHSLFDYFSYGVEQAASLAVAIGKLFKKYDDKDIYYFTATTELLEKFAERNGDQLFSNLKVIDYREDREIKQYRQTTVKKFTHMYETLEHISDLDDFREKGDKGLVYSERIKGMKEYEEGIRNLGYRVISLWSVNNKDYPMNEEQLRVRKYIAETEMMPDEYDFIIYNGSMREGWNMKDERVKFLALNTNKSTDAIQARGRVRGDLAILLVRTEDNSSPLEVKTMSIVDKTRVIDDVLGKDLTSEDKKKLALDLKIIRENGSILMWRGLKGILENNGYLIEDKVKRVNGKQVRYSVISKVEEESEVSREIEEEEKVVHMVSPEESSSKFISGLKLTGFERENRVNLVNYMGGKGIGVAYAHIKASYVEYVTNKGWSEREFADVTYIIASKGVAYTKANYMLVRDEGYSRELIISERAKYSVDNELRERAKARNEEAELLAYIRDNM